MSKLGPISHCLSPVSCDSLVLQGLRCEWWTGVLNLVLSLSLSHTGHWKFNMAPQRTLWGSGKRSVALHKDGVCYTKIAKTLKLICSTVAKTIQWFNRTGSTQNRPRHGRPKKLSARAQRHIQRLCLRNRRMSAASIAAEVEGVERQPVSAQTIRCILHQIGRPRRKPLLKMMHTTSFAEDKQTKDMDYCMSAAELQFIEGTMNVNLYCDILKQSMIPSLRSLDRREVFQHDNDPKHIFKMTTALLKKLRVKVMDWPSMSPDLNPIEHLWGILKRKVEEPKVSNIHQLRDVVMEKWKRTPGQPLKLWWTPWKRVKAVLENNGGHTKYWHFGPNLDIFT